MKLIRTATRHPYMYPRLFIAYGPGLVLREDAHWRNWRAWNGIGFRLRGAVHWWLVRS